MSVPYHLGRFPPDNLDWSRLLPLIGPANAAVARYEGVLSGIPNPDVLLAPLTSQEAVLSSRIEGTQATLGEVLEFEAEGDLFDEGTPKKADIREVLNYRAALKEASGLLADLPFSERIVRRTHEVLMQGVRGRNKAPGEYRRIANWIGAPGCAEAEARFVPVSADHVPDAMRRWERYAHSNQPDILVQLAVLHAEFEAIHPFLDGNGRLGRLLIPLFLASRRVLPQPNFYLSEYLEQRRDEYYERLLAVSRDDDWTGWCAFFLRALTEQAEANVAKARAILALYNRLKDWIVDAARSQYAVRALDWMFARPIFRSADFVRAVDIPQPTAQRIVRVARQTGLLTVLDPARGRRSGVLAFSELINIAEGRPVLEVAEAAGQRDHPVAKTQFDLLP
jgi:Fic family protein